MGGAQRGHRTTVVKGVYHTLAVVGGGSRSIWKGLQRRKRGFVPVEKNCRGDSPFERSAKPEVFRCAQAALFFFLFPVSVRVALSGPNVSGRLSSPGV